MERQEQEQQKQTQTHHLHDLSEDSEREDDTKMEIIEYPNLKKFGSLKLKSELGELSTEFVKKSFSRTVVLDPSCFWSKEKFDYDLENESQDF